MSIRKEIVELRTVRAGVIDRLLILPHLIDPKKLLTIEIDRRKLHRAPHDRYELCPFGEYRVPVGRSREELSGIEARGTLGIGDGDQPCSGEVQKVGRSEEHTSE